MDKHWPYYQGCAMQPLSYQLMRPKVSVFLPLPPRIRLMMNQGLGFRQAQDLDSGSQFQPHKLP
jgi:hypothetical protein